MHRAQKLRTQTTQRIGDLQPRLVVHDRHDDVNGLDREHALKHPYVSEYGNPPYLARERRVGVVVEPEYPVTKPVSHKDVEGHPPVPASPDYGYSHLLVEVDTLYLDFGFRCGGGCFGLPYLDLLPFDNPARYFCKFSTLSGILRL